MFLEQLRDALSGPASDGEDRRLQFSHTLGNLPELTAFATAHGLPQGFGFYDDELDTAGYYSRVSPKKDEHESMEWAYFSLSETAAIAHKLGISTGYPA